jgi:ribulose-5-phosphate 4-epimerase/fuculose-1-phosphate aldolase
MVAYHDFEGITVHADEGPRLLASMAARKAVILRNHGLLAWGTTLAQAFAVLWTLQRACDVQVATGSAGTPLPIPEEVVRKSSRDALQFSDRFGAGQNVFDAMMRLVDKTDDSYKT